MKVYQPLAVTGFSFCIALLTASLLPFDILITALIPLFVIFLGTVIFMAVKGFDINRTVIAISLFLVFAAAGINAGYRFYTAKVVSSFPETPVRITATVEKEYNSGSFIVKTESVDVENFPQRINIMLYTSDGYEFLEGEKFCCDIKAYREMPSRSQQGKGAVISGRIAGNYTLLKETPPERKFISKCREELKASVNRTVSFPYNTVLIAMLLGDTEEMDSGIYDSFNIAGISHILCVSGLHISLICGFFAAFFGFIFGRKLISDVLGILITLFFVILTGAGPSAVRAFTMAVALILSRHIVRNYSPVNILGGIAFLFCVTEPYIIYNNGFLMSVFAVFSLCTAAADWVGKIIRKFSVKNRIITYILNLSFASFSVSLFLIPIMLMSSGYTSALSPIANLIIIPLVPFAMILGIISSVTNVGFLGFVAEYILKWMHFVAGIIKDLPFSILPLNFGYIKGLLVGVLIIVIVAFFVRKLKEYSLHILIMSLVLFMIGGTVQYFENRNVLNVAVLEANGSSSVVMHENDKAIVVNCGSGTVGRKTAQYLRSVGIDDFELLLVTSDDREDGAGTHDLVLSQPPKEVICSPLSNYVGEVEGAVMTELAPLKRTVLEDALLEIGDTVTIKAKGKEFFVDESSFGILNGTEKVILRKVKKVDTLEQKYDIMETADIKLLEKENFLALRRGRKLVLRITENGKMLLKED